MFEQITKFANETTDSVSRTVNDINDTITKTVKDTNASERFTTTSDQVLDAVLDANRRIVDMAVSRLRQRLRDTEKPPRLIRTVRGSGYQLAANVVAGNAH